MIKVNMAPLAPPYLLMVALLVATFCALAMASNSTAELPMEHRAIIFPSSSAADEDGLVPVTLTYNDILAKNKSCGSRDSCALRKTDRKMDLVDWKVRNCFCDAQCAAYGDCCVDSKFYEAERQKVAFEEFSCVGLRQFGNIYMKDSCPKGYPDAEVAAKCITGVNPVEDPFASMPLTSKNSTFTYKNFYCAMCHDDVRHPLLWIPRVECPTLKPTDPGVESLTPSVVGQDIEFDAKAKRWGVRVGDDFHVCHVDPVFPEFVEPYIRKCRHAISSCLENYPDANVVEKCRAYTAYVYDFDTAYRNVHCAECNNVTLAGLSCVLNDFARGRFFEEEFNPLAFAVLLDISPSPSGFDTGTVGQVSACGEGQLYDPFFKKCRNVFCGQGSVWKNGACTAPPTTTTTTTTTTAAPAGNDTTVATTLVPPAMPDAFATCPKFYLSKADFEYGANDTVFVPVYNRTYKKGEFELLKLGDGSTVIEICAVGLDTVEKFTPLMGYISVFCLLLSIACLVLHLAATALVPELRNLSGKNMAALCSALLLAYALFLAGQFRFFKENACAVVGSCMYYAFLASFFWMNCMSFDVWRSLRLATSELRLSSGKQLRKFLTYSAYAWLVPALLVALAVGIDVAGVDAVPLEFRPGFGVSSCWFSHRTALMIYFAAPLGFVMTSNLIFFALSAQMIYSTTESSRKIKSGCNPTRIDFKLYSRLALIMGLTWVVGLVVGYLDRQLDPHSLLFFALWYLFIGLNALQGVFIFVTFTCTKKVYDGLADRWKLIQRRRRTVGKENSFSWSFSNTSTSEGGKKRIIESTDSTDSHLSSSGLGHPNVSMNGSP